MPTPIDQAWTRLYAYLQAQDFAGYDPFDSLNSTLFQRSPFARSRLARLAWLQAGKRSPINFRSLVGVPMHRNPKAIGLIILGLLSAQRWRSDPECLAQATTLGDWLLGNRVDRTRWQHSAWGYPFDWQSRAFFAPKDTPNVIATSYAARALVALADATGIERYAHAAIDAGRFVAKNLHHATAVQPFFGYISGESALVHNASLWGAVTVARAGQRDGDAELLACARSVLDTTLSAQKLDGSWPYGGRDHHQFIDGFHTGFNLEALVYLRDALDAPYLDEAIARGYRYYVDSFFEKDGLPKYYNNQAYPVDCHSAAQALITCALIGNDAESLALANKVLDWTLSHMYDPKIGCFAYQRGRIFTNWIPYLRWTQAWMFHGLSAHLARAAANNEAHSRSMDAVKATRVDAAKIGTALCAA